MVTHGVIHVSDKNFSNKVLRKLRTYSKRQNLMFQKTTQKKEKKVKQAISISFKPDGIISFSFYSNFNTLKSFFKRLRISTLIRDDFDVQIAS